MSPVPGNGADDRRFVAGSAVLGLVVAAVAVLAAGPWDTGQRKAEHDRVVAEERTGGVRHVPDPGGPRPAPSAAAVLAALGEPSGRTAPVAAGTLDAVLTPLLEVPGLGDVSAASVVDTATGTQVYAHGATTPMTPASTVKIAGAVAALSALGPDHRIPTTVQVSKDARTLTLAGGGDPTLDGAALRALAAGTARALGDSVPGKVRLTYDTSRYSGPALHPISPNENIAPVSALMVDEGRLDGSDHGPAPGPPTPPGRPPARSRSSSGRRGCPSGPPPRPDGPARRPGRSPRTSPSRSPHSSNGP